MQLPTGTFNHDVGFSFQITPEYLFKIHQLHERTFRYELLAVLEWNNKIYKNKLESIFLLIMESCQYANSYLIPVEIFQLRSPKPKRARNEN